MSEEFYNAETAMAPVPRANRCAECGRIDPDTEMGWSLCGVCFHSDQFNGMAYWTPLWCALLWLIAVGWIVAAIVTLTRGSS